MAQSEKTRVPSPAPDFTKLGPDALKKGIENQHPSAYYILAEKLFESGQKDEAVFWFYVGQLRYRFKVSVNPGPPDGDPALLASLNAVLGEPINQYGFGDLKTLHETLEKVLTWDQNTPNGFTSKEANAKAWNETRSGLAKLIEYIDQNGDSIRKQRAANGLPNR
jgi:hypothetical protein